MAGIDPWGYDLRKEIAAMLQHEGIDLIKVSTTARDIFGQGTQEGLERVLRKLFVRRIGRTLTETEQQALTARAHSSNPEKITDRALSLEGDALVAWLLDPNAK